MAMEQTRQLRRTHFSDIEYHRGCIGGTCEECEGQGDHECDNCDGSGDCTCDRCSEDHDCGECEGLGRKPCGHCEGTGHCDYGPSQREYDDALESWTAIKEALAPLEVSTESFRIVFARMFGRPATESEVTTWRDAAQAFGDYCNHVVGGDAVIAKRA